MPSATLVIDVQNSFFLPAGAAWRLFGPVVEGEAVRKNIRALTKVSRERGTAVIYTRHCYSAGYPEADRGWRRAAAEMIAEGGLLDGSWDASLVEDVWPEDSDFVVKKSRYDGFLGTSLSMVLEGLNVDQLFVAGALTNTCVQATAFSAVSRGYDVCVVRDATAARSAALQELALSAIANGCFSEIASTAEVLDSLHGSS